MQFFFIDPTNSNLKNFTSQKFLADNQLMENELKILRATLNSSLDGILVVDHKSQKVIDFNQRFLDLWGIPKELSDQRNDATLLEFVLSKLSNPEGFIDLVMKLYSHSDQDSIDVLGFKDGRTFERHSVPMVVDDKITGRIWFFRDISDKIEKDKALRFQEVQLMEASKLSSLGLLAGGIAHEINNPLAIIKTSIRVITQILKKDDEETSQVKRHLGNIETTVERIAHIVTGLRNISHNPGKEEKVSCSFNDILSDVLNLASEKFKGQGVEIIIPDSPELLGRQFVVNRVQLSEVLINLLNNSFDAVLDLPEKWVKITLSIRDKKVFLSIIDSGRGIPEIDQLKIFDPFYTTKSIGKGSGIGLSITRSLIKRNGGELLLDPKSENTKFDIVLPLG